MQQQQPSPGSAETGGGLRADAAQLGNSAANRIHGEIDSRKGAAVEQAKSVSSAIDRAAGEMAPETPEWLRSALRQGAQKIEQFADTIGQKDSRALLQDAQDFARNNPGTFLIACAAAGFAAARVLKAGSEGLDSAQNDKDQQSNRSHVGGPAPGRPPRVDERTRGEFA